MNDLQDCFFEQWVTDLRRAFTTLMTYGSTPARCEELATSITGRSCAALLPEQYHSRGEQFLSLLIELNRQAIPSAPLYSLDIRSEMLLWHHPELNYSFGVLQHPYNSSISAHLLTVPGTLKGDDPCIPDVYAAKETATLRYRGLAYSWQQLTDRRFFISGSFHEDFRTKASTSPAFDFALNRNL